MKKFCILPFAAALAFFVSCQKQQSEQEKKAEVERQERLAAEHQVVEKQRLAQQQADLEAREKALADKDAAAATANVPAETPVEAPQTVQETRDTSERRSTASYGTFYQKLEPYGAWRETSDYGYVWQPLEAEESHNWRPYTDGRWVSTWRSDEAAGRCYRNPFLERSVFGHPGRPKGEKQESKACRTGGGPEAGSDSDGLDFA